MKYDIIVTIIVAVFASGGFWSFLQTFVQKKSASRDAEQKLILGLAFKTIIEMCQRYIEVGEIDAEEYKELKHYLFEPYAAMGGDGTAERMIKEVEKLPIKERK